MSPLTCSFNSLPRLCTARVFPPGEQRHRGRRDSSGDNSGLSVGPCGLSVSHCHNNVMSTSMRQKNPRKRVFTTLPLAHATERGFNDWIFALSTHCSPSLLSPAAGVAVFRSVTAVDTLPSPLIRPQPPRAPTTNEPQSRCGALHFRPQNYVESSLDRDRELGRFSRMTMVSFSAPEHPESSSSPVTRISTTVDAPQQNVAIEKGMLL